jgi:hypothetical protein
MRKRNRADKMPRFERSTTKMEPLYTVAEAAEMYGKSPSHVNRLLVSNSINPVRESYGKKAKLYYKKSDVIALGKIMGLVDA